MLLKNVTLSFPNVFQPKAFNPGDTPKFGGQLLIDLDSPDLAELKQEIQRVAVEKWGENIPPNLKLCLRDGAEKAHINGYEGRMFVSASNDMRPTVINRDRSPIIEEDGKIYAGCVVNADIRLWAQDNQYGKRINAQLNGVQFVADGERFGGGAAPSSPDAFPELDPMPEPGAAPAAATPAPATAQAGNGFSLFD